MNIFLGYSSKREAHDKNKFGITHGENPFYRTANADRLIKSVGVDYILLRVICVILVPICHQISGINRHLTRFLYSA